MNRRQFTTSLAALAAAPLVPALPAGAAAAAPGFSGAAAMHYPWAVRYARVHNACSPDRLVRAFRLSPEVARQIVTRMQANGVITAPGLSGLARAVDPVNWDMQMGRHAAQSAGRGVSQRLRRLITDHGDEAPEADTAEADEVVLDEANVVETETQDT